MAHHLSHRAYRPSEATLRVPSQAGAWVRARYLSAGAEIHLQRGRLWRRGSRLFSHTVVGWAAGAWRVQAFYLDRFRRRRTQRRIQLHQRLLRSTAAAATHWARPDWPARAWSALAAAPARAGRVWAAARAGAVGQLVQLVWCPLELPPGGGVPGGIRPLQALVRYRLRGRHQRRIKSVVWPLLQRVRSNLEVTGAAARCNGRFTRAQRASHEVYQWGRLGQGDPSQRVEAAFVTAPLRFGSVGVTLMVNYGDQTSLSRRACG